jgi:hypothetical protein
MVRTARSQRPASRRDLAIRFAGTSESQPGQPSTPPPVSSLPIGAHLADRSRLNERTNLLGSWNFHIGNTQAPKGAAPSWWRVRESGLRQCTS